MAQMQKEDQRLNPEAAPDPDEDNLSDLDDMLDEFSSTKLAADPQPSVPVASSAPPPPAATSSSTTHPQQSTLGDDDFAKQLQTEMANLLGQLDSDPTMKTEFEGMLKELGAATAAADAADPQPSATSTNPTTSTTPNLKPTPNNSNAKKPAEDSFQDTIRRTIERMQSSGETASAAAASSSEDDILAQMLKEMESGGAPDLGAGDEDLNTMLMGMMEQLTNKDILYDPMKELHEKYPAWLNDNKDKIPEADLARYKEQQTVVADIVARFERKEYSDDSKEDREYIVDRMQTMQAAGSPPSDLVGDMNATQEALGDLDSGCPQQ